MGDGTVFWQNDLGFKKPHSVYPPGGPGRVTTGGADVGGPVPPAILFFRGGTTVSHPVASSSGRHVDMGDKHRGPTGWGPLRGKR